MHRKSRSHIENVGKQAGEQGGKYGVNEQGEKFAACARYFFRVIPGH
jgi:hypothetical protein